MKTYKGYLIDLDGTMYRGTDRIESASEFVQALQEKEIPYLYVTNNSTKTQEDVAAKLNRLDIPSTSDQVLTSSIATANYISKHKPNATCYVIGEEGLVSALEQKDLTLDDKNCDYVVIGMDRNISYEKLAKACLLIRNGATFLSTNSDVAIPTERGLLPGNGALTSVITVSTGIEPIFIGKPSSIIMEEGLYLLGLEKEEVLMVGDNYHTDILAGIKAGVDTLMVFTGVTPKSDYPTLETKPTYYVNRLDEWISKI
ncbi:TIGR01457 family HAD-type hydrolase [Oceanobacillus halotolerans]|uniref:TIGR01457 family HAD-type hydrolase n=1 Tax=Oceanobacillus halotolerans TaxID=2663380 RepID=UPI0013DC2444|nr:TIGR01457 family HAD-type hydrolase [Oceanobacillus halotolerans]